MTLLTEEVVRARARKEANILRKSTEALLNEAAGPDATFDVFLSHSSNEDREILLGVKSLLEDEGLTVYVDRYSDPQLSPDRVTAETAAILRKRLRASSGLLYAYSVHSTASRWMPRELGFFDGINRPVYILPVIPSAGAAFPREEYLGLYPCIERGTLGLVGGARLFFLREEGRTRLVRLKTVV